MAIIISHNHYLFVPVVSILVFQTFDRMKKIFEFSWSNWWYVVTVWVPQMVRDKKNFENHWCSGLEVNRFSSKILPQESVRWKGYAQFTGDYGVQNNGGLGVNWGILFHCASIEITTFILMKTEYVTTIILYADITTLWKKTNRRDDIGTVEYA